VGGGGGARPPGLPLAPALNRDDNECSFDLLYLQILRLNYVVPLQRKALSVCMSFVRLVNYSSRRNDVYRLVGLKIL